MKIFLLSTTIVYFIPQKAKLYLKTGTSVQNMDCSLDLAREQLDLHPVWLSGCKESILQGAANLWKVQAYINIQG